jgi:hypothetical protein
VASILWVTHGIVSLSGVTDPGVAVITPQVVTRGAHAITVVGLRIRMLPATGAPGVYDIARSNAGVLG